ncbi:hypothetical protein CBL_02779 [Carabus blaptoides fortunei]
MKGILIAMCFFSFLQHHGRTCAQIESLKVSVEILGSVPQVLIPLPYIKTTTKLTSYSESVTESRTTSEPTHTTSSELNVVTVHQPEYNLLDAILV